MRTFSGLPLIEDRVYPSEAEFHFNLQGIRINRRCVRVLTGVTQSSRRPVPPARRALLSMISSFYACGA